MKSIHRIKQLVRVGKEVWRILVEVGHIAQEGIEVGSPISKGNEPYKKRRFPIYTGQRLFNFC
ncbi:hypothetical protein FLK61_23595 [Paenalkalicoccus suaedae]|uniref:Uncharacterized protein n=1 Tax=Paenalkalicoccus suaedae TaxID=2592382 RepID=A0A859F9K3_9BACI|nr:hypothetical protein [Paenalkalicoccus suaedae]QKS69779.1 hypothetical protein FLK61_23595 [Paenalkalicoccus suaedae]